MVDQKERRYRLVIAAQAMISVHFPADTGGLAIVSIAAADPP